MPPQLAFFYAALAAVLKMLTFLSPISDLEKKFEDIIWKERERIAIGSRPDADEDNRWGTYHLTDMSKGPMDRYSNIKPWSHNRVKLRVPPAELDYVNASAITLEPLGNKNRTPLRYIAMQGPTPPSVPFVWRMFAEQLTSPMVIVQLTDMVEGGMVKCFPYLPMTMAQTETEPWTVNEQNAWGDDWEATLALDKFETLENGAIELRKLKLQVKDDAKPRDVFHFLYTKWPDFGVPALEDIDSFLKLMRLSRAYNKANNPRIIHCSAGVGRTGTFITLEHLLRELDDGFLENYDGDGEKDDLVFQTVNSLREQRRSMVQAEPQFLFIYQVLRKLWLDKYGQGEDGEGDEEPAAKRLEVSDPFFE
jgi:protein-tyrosine phosphatase